MKNQTLLSQKLTSLVIFSWHQCRITEIVLPRFRSFNKLNTRYKLKIHEVLIHPNQASHIPFSQRFMLPDLADGEFTDDLQILLEPSPNIFKDTDIQSSRQGWRGQRRLGRIFGSRSRFWRRGHAFCSHAKLRSDSHQSSRRNWCSLSHPDIHTHNRHPRGREQYCSSAAEMSLVWC